MATLGFLSPIGTPTQQFFTDQGVVLSGGFINTYLAGTTTPAATFTTSNLAISNPNPIVLDTAGRCPQEVWLQQGVTYKFVVTDQYGSPVSVGPYDNISGINDVTGGGGGGGGITSEWITSTLTPTYISGTQFSVPGNQTAIFAVGRRMYATVSAGTVYGTITAVSFSSSTEVTVLWDSGELDSGLSSVAYALLNSVDPSEPANNPVYKGLLNIQVITATGTLAVTPGANRARIRMCGSGASGGGCPQTLTALSSAAGGGSAASYLELWVGSDWQSYNGTALTIGALVTGTASADGTAGNPTTFGTYATCPGGNPGGEGATFNSATTAGFPFIALGGISSTAPTTTLTSIVAMSGGVGGNAAYSGNALSMIGVGVAGNGGSGPLGIGGCGSTGTSPATPGNGSGYGSGGAGAAAYNNSLGVAGGSSAPGVIIIEEYL